MKAYSEKTCRGGKDTYSAVGLDMIYDDFYLIIFVYKCLNVKEILLNDVRNGAEFYLNGIIL